MRRAGGADRKVKGTIHWLSADYYAEDTTLMLYDNLFTLENVADIPEGKTYDDYRESGLRGETGACKDRAADADGGAGRQVSVCSERDISVPIRRIRTHLTVSSG